MLTSLKVNQRLFVFQLNDRVRAQALAQISWPTWQKSLSEVGDPVRQLPLAVRHQVLWNMYGR